LLDLELVFVPPQAVIRVAEGGLAEDRLAYSLDNEDYTMVPRASCCLLVIGQVEGERRGLRPRYLLFRGHPLVAGGGACWLSLFDRP
jgi:hypothetical protein